MDIEVYKPHGRLKMTAKRKLRVKSKLSSYKPTKKLLRATRGKKKPKRFKQSIWEEFGIKRPIYIRYSGYGGVLWFLLSQHVRKEEFEQYGTCVDGCGRAIDSWQFADCGHFRSAKSLATRFLRENLGLQTKHCNSPRGGNGNQYQFGLAIDRRYGPGTADRLTELSHTISRPLSKDWYRNEIKKYL